MVVATVLLVQKLQGDPGGRLCVVRAIDGAHAPRACRSIEREAVGDDLARGQSDMPLSVGSQSAHSP